LTRKVVSVIILAFLLGSTFFSAIVLVESETGTHNLRVVLEAGPRLGGHHLRFGRSRVLNATVWNDGNVTETEVTLLLLINGSEVVHSTVANLPSGGFYRSSYVWCPSERGVYNVTAYAPPITYPEPETNRTNNVASWLIYVCDDVAPIVNFTYSPLKPVMNEPVTFDASNSTDPDWGNITTYSWNFNGTIVPPETDPVTTYKFTKHGNATVTLTLYDTEGNSSSTFKSFRVYARPVAHFAIPTIGPYYVGYPLTFDASASRDPDNDTGPTKGIINYIWDFDDGNKTIIGDDEPARATISHSYATPGVYRPKLTVKDNDNLVSSIFSSVVGIQIQPGIPVARWEITNPPYYVNKTLTFDASNSTADGGNIVKYSWIWDDGTTNEASTPIINHTFTKAKTYNVTLTVTDSDNKSGSTSQNVPVVIPVYIRVEPETIESDPESLLNVNITIANVEDLKKFELKLKWPPEWLPPEWYLLKYQSEHNGTFLGPQRYLNGTERWKGTAEYGDGWVYINYNFTSIVPKAERSGSGTLVTIEFLVLSSGNTTLDLCDTKLLNSLGNPIDHSVEDGYFYTERPVADFNWSPKPSIIKQIISFNGCASYDPDNPYDPTPGPFKNYSWDFGDNTTDTGKSCNHTYLTPGNYRVTLTVTDDDDQTWSIPKTVEVISGRDVAVIRIEPCMLAFNETLGMYETAGILPINVTVKNEGTEVEETFDVTLYYSNITIGVQHVEKLPAGNEKTLTFNWSIQEVAKGDYNISAYAYAVIGENDLDDNYLKDGTVRVYLPGDCNRDGKVNIYDLRELAKAYGSRHVTDPQDPKYCQYWHKPSCLRCPHNPNADLTCDGKINIYDLRIVAQNYGKTDP